MKRQYLVLLSVLMIFMGISVYVTINRSPIESGGGGRATVAPQVESTSPTPNPQQHKTRKQPSPQNAVSNINSAQPIDTDKLADWLHLPLSAESFAMGIAFLQNEHFSDEEFFFILDKLRSWRRHLDPQQIRLLLSEVTNLAHDNVQSTTIRAQALRAIGIVLIVMQETGIITRTEVESYFPALKTLVENHSADALIRGAAIRTLGLLNADGVESLAKTMLEQPDNLNDPELARNACLALARTGEDSAVQQIGIVLAETNNEAVFGTAAFALGQIPTETSLVLLVQNKDRFPNSGSIESVLVDMESVILAILEDGESSNVLPAIAATRHLWREGQRDTYTPLLRDFITSAPLLSIKQMAIERLIEDAAALPLKEEQLKLAVILPAVIADPGLSNFAQRIEDRLASRIIIPDAEPIPVPER